MAIFGHVLLAIFSLFVQSDAFMCFECQGIPYPRDCAKVRVCNSHEQCFTEQIVTTSGHVVYNTGCLSKTRCTTTSGMIVGKRSTNIIQRSSTDLSTCTECCLGDFCNNKGCGTQIVPIGQRGPYCFNCDAVLDPKKCSNVAVCDITEQCILYSPAEFKGLPETLYKSYCVKKSTCSILAHVFSNYRCPPTCCDTDFCNNQCGLSSNHSMTTPLPHTMPSNTQTHTLAVTTHGAIRDTPAHILSPTHHSAAFHCDTRDGYMLLKGAHENMCVHIVTHKANWYDARVACRSEGGDLIVLDNSEKELLVHNVVAHSSETVYWIGAKKNHGFTWVNGRPVNYNNWHSGEPNGGDCVDMRGSEHYEWHDNGCHHSYVFICERR